VVGTGLVAGVRRTPLAFTQQQGLLVGDKTTFWSGQDLYLVDGAMNDLIRPSLYSAYHAIMPVVQCANGQPEDILDVVGPICESGDFLAKERSLPLFRAGDLLAVMSAGAYGFAMASNYNSRPRAPEVLVKGDEFFTIRARETYADLIRGETIPAFMSA
ncbi:MAG: hypothetical protein HYZ81_09825, partial [Nitrospinae bacterium]|nr:hypothetical protein [Nitrospinota bacterium]